MGKFKTANIEWADGGKNPIYVSIVESWRPFREQIEEFYRDNWSLIQFLIESLKKIEKKTENIGKCMISILLDFTDEFLLDVKVNLVKENEYEVNIEYANHHLVNFEVIEVEN